MRQQRGEKRKLAEERDGDTNYEQQKLVGVWALSIESTGDLACCGIRFDLKKRWDVGEKRVDGRVKGGGGEEECKRRRVPAPAKPMYVCQGMVRERKK